MERHALLLWEDMLFCCGKTCSFVVGRHALLLVNLTMFTFPLLDALVLATVLPSSKTQHQICDLTLQESVHVEGLSAVQVTPIGASCYVVPRLPTYGRTGIMVSPTLLSEHVMTATASIFS
jgi:hypothetical protein